MIILLNFHNIMKKNLSKMRGNNWDNCTVPTLHTFSDMKLS